MQYHTLLGYPISHSLSPSIHNTWFKYYKMDAFYTLTPCSLENLPNTITQLQSNANVTMPLKQAIIPYLQHIDPKAQQVGAINTLLYKKGEKTGYNTDIDGVLYALSTVPSPLETTLIIGTGGASKACIVALASLGSSITVQGRNLVALQHLKQQFPFIHTLQWHKAPASAYSLINNATAVELTPQQYHYPLTANVAFDLRYTPPLSAFLQHIKANQKLNGLPMVKGQAAKAFEIWHGFYPDISLINSIGVS